MQFYSQLDTSGVFYMYDGSFDGLLSVIYTAVYSRTVPVGISTEKSLQLAFDTRYKEIETNKNHAKRVYDAIYKKIGSFGLKRLYYVFLSDEDDKDMVIYSYMMLGFKNGNITNNALSNDTVARAFRIAENVSRETERFRQFTRFSVMDWGVQYAKITPHNNVLPLLTPFFAGRLKIIPFILHDVTHDLCAVYDTKNWHISSSEGLTPPSGINTEDEVTGLWKTFFDAVSIKERENTKLQRQNMPARYFKNVWAIK